MTLFEDFLQFEEENDLFEGTYINFKYWEFIRIKIFNSILQKENNLGEGQIDLKSISNFDRLIKRTKNIISYNDQMKLFDFNKADVLVLNHQRRVKVDDFYECLYTDAFLEEINRSTIVLEQPYIWEHFNPTKTKNLIYTDLFGVILDIEAEILYLKNKAIQRNNNDDIVRLKRMLKIKFDFDVDLEDVIIKAYSRYTAYTTYFRKMIEEIEPKVVLEVVYYSEMKMYLNVVAKQLGIPVIEFQHGIMGQNHIAYNFLTQRTLQAFPDYIFTFGDIWKDNTRFPIENSNITSVGWPYLERKVNTKKPKYLRDNKKNILFLSQGTIGKELSQFAVNLLKILPKEYHIVYKLHPAEYSRWKTDYPYLLNDDITVIDNNKIELHDLFADADMQIGVYTTALFEGIAYNLPTYIVKLFGYEHMSVLKDVNNVEFVTNIDELKQLIVNNIGNNTQLTTDYIWKKDSLNKTLKNIEYVIQKSS